jgi:DNA-binding MarR family transcriptional regulator
MSLQSEARTTAVELRAAISLLTRRVRESKSPELSLPERTALSRLDRRGSATTADLARWEEISPQAMGTTIAALERRGLVGRAPDPEDGRRSILTITSQGVALVRATRGELTDRLTAALDEHFTTDEMELIRAAAPLIERLAELS